MATLNIGKESVALRQMAVSQLVERYQAVCGRPAHTTHKERLVRAILWYLQARREGGLSERARLRALELVDPNEPLGCLTARAKKKPPVRRAPGRDVRLPKVGTILVRQYRGRLLQVRVLEHGFEFDDRHYPSLTAVTRHVTGKLWNGFHFFGLLKKDRPS